MTSVLGLLTGWALLIPLALVVFLRLGGAYGAWMAPFIGVAASAPMLGIMSVAGLILIVLSVRRMLIDAS